MTINTMKPRLGYRDLPSSYTDPIAEHKETRLSEIAAQAGIDEAKKIRTKTT